MIDLLAALRRYLYIVILDLNLTSFNKNSKIKIFLLNKQFQEEPGPCVLLLIYSAILSRGLDQWGLKFWYFKKKFIY